MSAASNSAVSSVAQILRDRALVEQVEINETLRAELDASLKVEITGPQGDIYAQGDFRDGEQVDRSWMVSLDKWPSEIMSLSKFIKTEVRIGGVWSGVNLNRFLIGNMTGINNVERTFTCIFASPARFCACTVQLNGLPIDSLERLEAALEQNREANGSAEVLGVHKILSDLAEIHRAATVTVLSVTFVEGFDRYIIERAKRCQTYSKGTLKSNPALPITTVSHQIATSLAEALSDNVLEAQLEINQDIRAEIEASLKVEVISAAGGTIYAKGAFQDGLPNVNSIMVPMDGTAHAEGIPLSGLNRLKVRVADITAYACPSSNLLRRLNQLNEQKQLVLFIGQSTIFCAVVLKLQGLPGHSLEQLEAAINHNMKVDYGPESHDIIEILNQLAEENSGARAHVVGIEFDVSFAKPMNERAKSFAQIG